MIIYKIYSINFMQQWVKKKFSTLLNTFINLHHTLINYLSILIQTHDLSSTTIFYFTRQYLSIAFMLLFQIINQYSSQHPNTIMIESKNKQQSRGRPKKADHQNPEKNYFNIFSVHAQCVYHLTLMYVLEVFHPVKDQKRIGHSLSGFTIYEKGFPNYSFDTYQQDLSELGAQQISQHKQLAIFSKRLIGLGPTGLFKQMITIQRNFLNFLKKYSPSDALTRLRYDLICQKDRKLNDSYPFLRFSMEKLKVIKEAGNYEIIFGQVKKLWIIFIEIYTHCIFACYMKTTSNKYLRALSTDAPESIKNTLIGHPSLEQVMQLVSPTFIKKIQKVRVKGFQMITLETSDRLQQFDTQMMVKGKMIEKIYDDSDSELQQAQFVNEEVESENEEQQTKKNTHSNVKNIDYSLPKQSSFQIYNKSKNKKKQQQYAEQGPNKAQQLIMASEQFHFQNYSLTPQQLVEYASIPRKRVKVEQYQDPQYLRPTAATNRQFVTSRSSFEPKFVIEDSDELSDNYRDKKI